MSEVEFETGAALSPIERCYYEAGGNGGRFWVKTGDEPRYQVKAERQLVRWLKSKGLASSISKDELKAGQTLSEIDEALLEIENEREVDMAGDFAGWKAGMRRISGKKVLVTEDPHLPEPKQPDEAAPTTEDGLYRGFPHLGSLFARLFFGPDGYDQRPYHLAWIKRAYQSLRKGEPLRGHGVLIAGDVGCGKSLWIDVLKTCFGGKIARPLRYIFGETNFNAEMFKAPLLVVDDEGAKTHIADRKLLAARFKQIVAVKGASCEGKNRDAMEIHTFMRIIFATNLEEQNLLVFPPIDDDLADKVHLFRIWAGAWPWPADADEDAIWSILSQEIPYFLWWLLNEWECPAEIRSQRFGVLEFHHPEILQGIDFLSPEARLWNWIERTVLRASDNTWKGQMLPRGEWMGSATDLEAALRDQDNGLTWKEREKVPAANPTIGKFLGKLATRPAFAGQIESKRAPGGKQRYWRLLSREAVDGEQSEPEQEDIEL